MRLLPSLAVAALAGLTADSLSAQVVINEVAFKSNDQWIELYNPGSKTVDLGGWSIYQATKTANRSGNYWWPIPFGTKIAKDEYLRIRWGAKIPKPPVANEISTGDSNWHFLFGHGYETLDPAQGALAICTTQDNLAVSNPNIFNEWLQWGDTGFRRESIAINNKPASLWTSGNSIPVVPKDASAILHIDLDNNPPPLTAYAADFSPTPLKHNTGSAAIKTIGKNCNWGLTPVADFVGEGIPFHGNAEFAIALKDTGLAPAEFAWFFWSPVATTVGLRIIPLGPVCNFLDGSLGHVFWRTSTISPNTRLPLPILLNNLPGVKLWLQVFLFRANGEYQVTHRLELQISK